VTQGDMLKFDAKSKYYTDIDTIQSFAQFFIINTFFF